MVKEISQRLYEVSIMKMICVSIKKLGIPFDSFYKLFRFNGVFKVKGETGDFFYLIHNGGIIENEIFWKGLFQSWERDTGWLWEELCQCSDVIIDIGANKGIYSLVAKAINPKSVVYAFEPSRKTIGQLIANLEKNEFDIIVEQIALSNSNSKAVFYDVPYKNQSSASLSSKKLKENEQYKGEILEYEVETKKLSTYIEEHDLSKIDLIKLDVELHEPEVIEGLGDYLENYKPVIILEILRDEVARKLEAIVNLDDYIIFSLKDQYIVERRKDFYSKNDEGIMNYIFFHKEKEGFVRQNTSLFEER